METIENRIDTQHARRLLESHSGSEYVWASSEAARQRALSLLLVGSIAGKHGGSVHIDQATRAISVDVPDEKKLACAKEIEARVGVSLN